jgi:hypothetical protein
MNALRQLIPSYSGVPARRPGHRVNRPRPGRRPGDRGQAALVVVVALAVALSLVGAVMVNAISNNDPIVAQASIQRYAYRALASGINAYTSAINADPYLAACNANTNPGGPNAQAQCAGISYQKWSQVPGTDTGNGVIPEYYKFDNAQQIIDPATGVLTYLEVQIVGAAGFTGKDVYYSTVAKFTPANGFLDNVWWTNFESTGTPTQCAYYWQTYSPPANCTPVYFDAYDHITGPIFSNDSIYVSGGPNFGNYGVTTADPKCLFVDPGNGNQGKVPSPAGSNTNCALTASQQGITYSAANSSFSKSNYEYIPTDNSELANYAKQGGCYYTGPTTITLSAAGMVVKSPETSADGTGNSNGTGQTNDFGSDTSVCPINNSTPSALPVNGVIFVDGSGVNTLSANPFDGVGQTCNGTSPCSQNYYGKSSTPGKEGDAFVNGNLSGHLTIGAANDVVIDGPIKYADCTSWAGTAHQSACAYNNASTGTNDTLGLIAYNYVEVSRPEDGSGNMLKYCGASGALAAPLCNPATSGGGGLIIDASLLGLQQSFIVNNYGDGGYDGQLTVYGSIQQDARGPVGTIDGQGNVVTGYGKTYTFDPRLALYSPPYYLTPGTASWALSSSAESDTGSEPNCPPVAATPTKANGTGTYPYPAYPPSTSASPPSVAAGTGSCLPAS